MTTDAQSDTWLELYRACEAVPLTTEGDELEAQDLPPAMKVRVVERRGERVVVESQSSTPTQSWHYLVRRADLDEATTPPDVLPREGVAPTASGNTSGSPD